MNTNNYTVLGLPGIPTIREGDDLAGLIASGLAKTSIQCLVENDVVVVASKVVSIVEGRRIDLTHVQVGKEAEDLSSKTGKDARVVQVILQESRTYRLVGARGPIIARHKLGYELTSAGVDNSGDGGAFLLPENPDASAKALRGRLQSSFKLKKLGVIIADSDGRADRGGATVIAIGCAGLAPLRRTSTETGGRTKMQEETIVDMIAAAAGIVIGQRGRGVPFAVVRGVAFEESDAGVLSILHG